MAVLLPLWASYLARVYAWIVILTKDGTLDWTTQHLGLGSPNIAYTNMAMWIVFSYIWLPFMILPVYGALERIPDSFIEASADLGARNPRTLRKRGAPPRPARRRRRVDLHVLAHPRRLHHAAADRLGIGHQPHRQRHLRQHRPGQQPPVRRRARRSCPSSS